MRPTSQALALILGLTMAALPAEVPVPPGAASAETGAAAESVWSVPVHPAVTLTVSFPGPIEGVYGVDFIPPGASSELPDGAAFYLSHEPGSHLLSAVPLGVLQNPRNLNVVYGGRVYPLLLRPVADPRQATLSLTFRPRPPPPPPPSVQVLDRPPPPDYGVPTTASAVGFLNLVKLMSAMDRAGIEALCARRPGLTASLRDAAGRRDDAGAYSVTVLRAFRHDRLDLIGLVVAIRNTSPGELRLAPDTFAVRAGARVFRQLLADAPAAVPPGSEALAYVLVSGTAAGGPASRLSPDNDFRVSFEVVGAFGWTAETPPPAPPVRSVRIGLGQEGEGRNP